MNIIIEGADGVGKSTVIDLLSKKLQIPVIKMPDMKKYFDKGVTEEFSELYNKTIVQFRDFDFIQDRGFPSSIVYAKVYNRSCDLSYILEIDKLLKPKVIILTATDEILKQRRQFDEIISDEFRSDVNAEFVRLANNNNYQLIDTSNKTPEEVCQIILENL